MKIRAVSLAVLCVFLALPCLGQSTEFDAEILHSIKMLASDSSGKQFEVLYRNPERATELLIGNLEPLPRGKYLSDKTPQAVWIVRALRSLTGLDFKAKTRAALSSDESHFLDLDTHHRVKFFGTWMSRDSTWVAPEDAQISIIKQWRQWFAQHGHNYEYPNNKDFDDWYF